MTTTTRARTSAHPHAWLRAAATATVLVAMACSAQAQGRPGGGPPPGGFGGPGGGMGAPGGGGIGRPTMGSEARPANESLGGLALAPAGRWWDNKDTAKFIGLDSRQTKRLDEVFGSNRDTLQKLYKNLQHEEAQLDKITRAHELDENQIFQQIDRVAAARGELEKATAHMMLQIRKELSPQQAAKLDQLRPPPID